MLRIDCLATIGVCVFRCAGFGWRTFCFKEYNMRKKYLKILLTMLLVAILFCAAATVASAQDETSLPTSGTCGDNVNWLISNGTLFIYGSGEITKTFVFRDFGSLNGYPIYELAIGNGITSICSGAFALHRFSAVQFPTDGSLKYIGDEAFTTNETILGLCLNIPEGVTYFGEQYMAWCDTVSLPSTLDKCSLKIANLSSLDIGRFTGDLNISYLSSQDQRVNISVSASNTRYHVENNCLIETETKKLVLCGGTYNSNNERIIDIPSDGSVTTIGSGAFELFRKAHITIPKSVTKIEKNAFGSSMSYYKTTVYYEGTVEEWLNVDVEDGNEALQSEGFSCHVHEFGEWSVVYEETCTADGLKEHTCTACGEAASESIPAAHKLKYKEGKDVTCTEGGYLDYYVCLGCDYSTYEYIAPIGHLFLTYESNNDATCTKDGTKTSTCKRCVDAQDTATDDGTALGHWMGSATCTESASCQREGCEHTEGEPLGHLEISHDAKAPTCTESGWNEYETCQRCRYSSKKSISALGHNFVNYVSNGDADCTQDGTKTARCERCTVTDTVTDEGSALGHDMSTATCTKKPQCQREGCSYTEGHVLMHDFSQYIYNEDATCTSDGTKTATCTRCGETNTLPSSNTALGHDIAEANCTLPERCVRDGCSYTFGEALGHDIKNHEQKAPTCTEVGWNAYDSCGRCSYNTYSEIAKLGHNFENYLSNNDATCTQDGTKTAKCERCTATDTVTDEDSALGHDMSDATCTEVSKCLRDGCEHTVGNALGHNFANYVSNNDATCTQDGTKTAKCESCSVTDTQTDENTVLGHDMSDATCTEVSKCLRDGCEHTVGNALGHNFANYVSNNDATCTQDGTKTAKCESCSVTDTQTDENTVLGHDMIDATCTEASKCLRDGCEHTVGNALGHNFANYVSNNDATCTQDGTKTAQCERCTITDTVTDADSVLGHDMSVATCEKAATCQRDGCNHTEGTVTEHTYLNEKDSDCNICGNVREAVHDEGLSTGAVIAIFAGSIVVVSTGGFSLFWFVIKKKKFADLIAIFKK